MILGIFRRVQYLPTVVSRAADMRDLGGGVVRSDMSILSSQDCYCYESCLVDGR